MNKDFRITVGFPHHPKTRKLQRRLGAEGPLALIYLWDFAAQNKPDGVLSGMDAEDIALACNWGGDAQEFVGALVDIRWLDEVDGVYVLHDWRDHNPYVSGAHERSEKAKKAAAARWTKDDAPSTRKHSSSHARSTKAQCSNDAPASSSNATSTVEQCSEHQLAMPDASTSNAQTCYEHPQAMLNHATSINEHCSEHDRAMLNDATSTNEQCSNMPLASSSNAPSPSPSPKKKKAKAKKEKLTVEQSRRFAAWYLIYPNKKARGDAERAWATLDPGDELTARMVQAVEAQTAWRERMKAAGEFVAPWKHPATWIRSKCWDDQLEEPKPKHDKRNQFDSDLKQWGEQRRSEIDAARQPGTSNTSH